ncbi:MAG TPA: VWA containing CoxE family protein [Candidatus Lokiarchaeia archaeon]|nr:VWA containing CoxE family protein [Candidatus Lokiarchaeia archaeon]
MFEDFFYLLRDVGIPVSFTEWMTLQDALDKNLDNQSLLAFYYMARSILVKDIKYYDQYDQAFAFYFKDKTLPDKVRQQLLDWLKNPANRRGLMQRFPDFFEGIDLDKLREDFEKLMREQKERHDGGNRWIGTGGESPFGNSGVNPAGIRVGGSGGGHMALQVAMDRKFQNYRHDIVLDTRQIKVALKKLRNLRRFGVDDELDLDETIDKTCKNCGDIDLVFRPPKKNQVKVALFMDAGGSMEPFANLVNVLFSAAHASNHFKDFKYFFFHNCIYEYVFTDIQLEKKVPTAQVVRELDKDYKVIIVGDASMAPYELTTAYGAISYYNQSESPGIEWLKRFERHFKKIIWLNPLDARYWNGWTTLAIGQIFKMFPLTIQGLDEAVKALL